MSGHTRDGVVQNDHGTVGLVIGDIGQPRHTGVHKRRIADDRDGFVFALLAERLVESVDRTDRRAHTERGLNGGQRRDGSQRIAANVAQYRAFVLFERVEQAPVRTARAHHRRTRRNRIVQRLAAVDFHPQFPGNQILRKLPFHGEAVTVLIARAALPIRQVIFLACHHQAQFPAVILNNGVQFFHDYKAVHTVGKVQNPLDRQGVDHAQFQHAGPVAENFFYILVTGRRCNNAKGNFAVRRGLRALLNPVQVRGFGERDQLARPLFHNRVAADRVSGHHDIFCDVLLIGPRRGRDPFRRLHNGLRVRHAGTHFNKDRRVKLFRQFKRALCKFQRLRAVRRLQHGDFRGDRVMAGILLVLGRVHSRVVRHADHHARVYARVRHRKQRVRRHVQPDVLHAAETPLSGKAGPKRHFHGDFLIGGPFAVNFIVFRGLFRDLRAGSAGITGNHRASRFIQAARRRRVAQHQLFHSFSPCFPQIQEYFREIPSIFPFVRQVPDCPPGISLPAYSSGSGAACASPSRQRISRIIPPAPPSSMDRRTRLIVALLAPVRSRTAE